MKSFSLFLILGDPDSPMDLSQPDSVLVSSDPKQDHNYSSSTFQRCSSRSSSSSSSSSSPSLSSLEEGGGIVGDSAQVQRAGSEGFHSDEDSEEENSSYPSALGSRRLAVLKCPSPYKKARRDVRPEVDEELKEAAGSLLHLAGIRSCQNQKKQKQWKASEIRRVNVQTLCSSYMFSQALDCVTVIVPLPFFPDRWHPPSFYVGHIVIHLR